MAKHISMKDIKPLKVNASSSRIQKILKKLGFTPYQSSKKKTKKKS